MNETLCTDAANLVKSLGYLTPSILNLVSCTGSLFIFSRIIRNHLFKTLYHVNIKVLLTLHILGTVGISVCCMASIGLTLSNAYVAKTDCDFFFLTDSCSMLRRAFLIFFILTPFSHASIFVERSYASYLLGAYERVGVMFSMVLGFFSVTGSVSIAGVVTRYENKDELLTSCIAFSSSASIGDDVYFMLKFLGVSEFVIFLLYIVLIVLNKLRWGRIVGNVDDRYQVNATFMVVLFLSPVVVSCCLVTSIYISGGVILRFFKADLSLSTYKTIAANIFVIPHLALFTMIGFNYALTRVSRDAVQKTARALAHSQETAGRFHENITKIWEKQYFEKQKSMKAIHQA